MGSRHRHKKPCRTVTGCARVHWQMFIRCNKAFFTKDSVKITDKRKGYKVEQESNKSYNWHWKYTSTNRYKYLFRPHIGAAWHANIGTFSPKHRQFTEMLGGNLFSLTPKTQKYLCFLKYKNYKMRLSTKMLLHRSSTMTAIYRRKSALKWLVSKVCEQVCFNNRSSD